MNSYFIRNITLASLPLIVAAVFVVLRLCGVICWQWWWVLSPLWIAGAALYTALILLVYYTKARE